MAQPTPAAPKCNLMCLPEEIFRQIVQESISPGNASLMIGARRSNQPQSLAILNLEAIVVLTRVDWKTRITLQTLIYGLDRNNYFVCVLSPEPILRLAQSKIGEFFFRTVADVTVDDSAVGLFQKGLSPIDDRDSTRQSDIFRPSTTEHQPISHRRSTVFSLGISRLDPPLPQERNAWDVEETRRPAKPSRVLDARHCGLDHPARADLQAARYAGKESSSLATSCCNH